jgi:hypothetical protein
MHTGSTQAGACKMRTIKTKKMTINRNGLEQTENVSQYNNHKHRERKINLCFLLSYNTEEESLIPLAAILATLCHDNSLNKTTKILPLRRHNNNSSKQKQLSSQVFLQRRWTVSFSL